MIAVCGTVPRVCRYCRLVFPGRPDDLFCCREHEDAYFEHGEMPRMPRPEPTREERQPRTRSRSTRPAAAKQPRDRKPPAPRRPRPRQCARCGREFEAVNTRAKYCSASCRVKRVVVTCQRCGRPFEAFASDVKRGHAQHCSRACRHAANSTRFTCPVCGREFDRANSKVRPGTTPCCSRECAAWLHKRQHQEKERMRND